MARLRTRETKRGWPATALLGILCLLAPAGLAAPALFVFVLLALGSWPTGTEHGQPRRRPWYSRGSSGGALPALTLADASMILRRRQQWLAPPLAHGRPPSFPSAARNS